MDNAKIYINYVKSIQSVTAQSHSIINAIALKKFREINSLATSFNVKSILEESRSSKVAYLAIPGALDIAELVNFSLQKAQKFIKRKIQSL